MRFLKCTFVFCFTFRCRLSAGFVYHQQNCKIIILYIVYSENVDINKKKGCFGTMRLYYNNNDMRVYNVLSAADVRDIDPADRCLTMQAVVHAHKKLNDLMFNIILLSIVFGVFLGFGRFTKLPFFYTVGVCRFL